MLYSTSFIVTTVFEVSFKITKLISKIKYCLDPQTTIVVHMFIDD